MEIAAFKKAQIRLTGRHLLVSRQEGIAIAQPPQIGGEIDKAFRHDMDDETGALHAAANGQKMRYHDDAPVSGEDFRPDDDDGDVSLVLKREKYDTLRGAGLLPDQHKAGDGDQTVLRKIPLAMLLVADGTELLELIAEKTY